MILFFDTETTGFLETKPHIVQLAALLCEPDGRERACLNVIIDNGVDVPEGAARVHGITREIAERCGVKPDTALDAFMGLVERADRIVAHNMDFDQPVLALALERADWPEAAGRFASKQMFCTMERATPILNLPPTDRMLAAGRNHPKSPNLGECVRHFFGEGLEGAHDAMVDVRACKRVYFALQKAPDA